MQRHRPRYETDGDRGRESDFSRLISQKFKCTLAKMPDLSGVDFCAIRDGRVVGFIETKIRSNPHWQYPTYMISLKKLDTASAAMGALNVPTVLAVRWSDAWGYVSLSDMTDHASAIGGRVDRADPQDMEPVALIPMSRFTITPTASAGCSPAAGSSASAHPADPAGGGAGPQESAHWP